MKTVLCLSFWVPPIIRPQSILIEKMLPQWKAYGYEPIVVHYESSGLWELPFKHVPIPEARFTRFITIEKILRPIYFKKILRLIEKQLDLKSIDLIFSFSNPQISNSFGAWLSSKFQIPFVSHFSDPYSNNPYKHLNTNEFKFIKKLEKEIITKSQAIIVTNSNAKKHISGEYPDQTEKFWVVEHCYDINQYPQIAPQKEKVIISHVGSFYQNRPPNKLFELLRRAKEMGLEFEARFIGACNQYAGFSQEKFDLLADQHGIKEDIISLPTVSYSESLKLMKESHILLLVDAKLDNSPFLPSKVIDYIGSQRPIIAITPADGPTAKVLCDIGFPTFTSDDIESAARFLEKLIQEKPTQFGDKELYFSAQSTQKRLTNIFDQVLEP